MNYHRRWSSFHRTLPPLNMEGISSGFAAVGPVTAAASTWICPAMQLRVICSRLPRMSRTWRGMSTWTTQSCKVCQGLTMSGGPIPGFPSSWPPALNLTFGEGSSLPTWTEQNFISALRTGVTPDGRELRAKYMPWRSYKFMNDEELKAVGSTSSRCRKRSMAIAERIAQIAWKLQLSFRKALF
jgi:hypothetical protein